MVIILEAHSAFTPAGNPVTKPIPMAPVVVCVIFSRSVFMHKEGVEEAILTVTTGVTLIVPLATKLSQPPMSGIL